MQELRKWILKLAASYWCVAVSGDRTARCGTIDLERLAGRLFFSHRQKKGIAEWVSRCRGRSYDGIRPVSGPFGGSELSRQMLGQTALQ